MFNNRFLSYIGFYILGHEKCWKIIRIIIETRTQDIGIYIKIPTWFQHLTGGVEEIN